MCHECEKCEKVTLDFRSQSNLTLTMSETVMEETQLYHWLALREKNDVQLSICKYGLVDITQWCILPSWGGITIVLLQASVLLIRTSTIRRPSASRWLSGHCWRQLGSKCLRYSASCTRAMMFFTYADCVRRLFQRCETGSVLGMDTFTVRHKIKTEVFSI